MAGRKYRILWGGLHTTLRYDEGTQWLEAGFEFVPVLGNSPSCPESWISGRERELYDNESEPLHPKWRESCTIPPDDLGRIRAADFPGRDHWLGRTGILSEAEQALINKYFDVIYCVNFPNVVLAALSWFRGLVIYRSFGLGDRPVSSLVGEFGLDRRMFLSAPRRHIFAPEFAAFVEPEDKLVANEFTYMLLNTPQASRFGGARWLGGRKAQNFIMLNLSYLDWGPGKHLYYKYYMHFDGLFKKHGIDAYRIFGKNDKKKTDSLYGDPHIVGRIDADMDFYRTLADCRVFAESGQNPYHLQTIGVDMFRIGVPVVMWSGSGLAREIFEGARLNPLSRDDFKEYGIFDDWDDMALAAKRCVEDFAYAESLAKSQDEIRKKVFSERRLLDEMLRFKADIPKLMEATKNPPEVRLDALNSMAVVPTGAKRADETEKLLRKIRHWLEFPWFIRILKIAIHKRKARKG